MKYYHEKYGMPPEMPLIKFDPGSRGARSSEVIAFKDQPVNEEIFINSRMVEQHETDRGVLIKTYEHKETGALYQLNPDQIAYLESQLDKEKVH